MSVKIRFHSAAATRLVLAKVGHPQKDEPLQTSKQVFEVADDDQPTLTEIFLKPFKNLTGHRFSHHSSLDQHEMNACVKSIFADHDQLLERGCEIAKRLYAKSNHPNIKSGDLCIALVRNVEVEGNPTQALCILKSESIVPFLSISTRNGDLQLSTEHGINPEKIDKGCLILDHHAHKGYHVLTFDRAGGESRFWVRDFLGVVPVADSPFLTNKFADIAVAVLKEEKPVEDDTPPWETTTAAKEALAYFEEKEKFSLQEFEEQVLRTPEAVEKFKQHRKQVEEEQGQPLEENFDISRKDVKKASKRIGTVMRLDTGVEIHVKPAFADQQEPVLERGFDKSKGMSFIKVFFNKDLNPSSTPS